MGECGGMVHCGEASFSEPTASQLFANCGGFCGLIGSFSTAYSETFIFTNTVKA